MTQEESDFLFLLVSRITVAIMFLPIIVAIWQRKFLNKPLKVFLFYRIFAVFFNLLEQLFIWFAINDYSKIKSIVEWLEIGDTAFLTITYQLNNFFFLGWFYYLLFPAKYGSWIKRSAIALFLAALTNYLFIEGHREFGTFNPTATAIFTFGIAFFYLWYIYRSQLALPLTKNPYFWFSLALIIPYLVNFFFFLISDVSHEEDYLLFTIMAIIKDAFLILGQILMAIGFWRARYAKYVPLPSQEAERT